MRKRITKIGVLALLAVFVLGAAIPAMAGDQAASSTPNSRGIARGAQNMIKALSELTGLDAAAIQTERQAGKSVLDIAKEKGVEEQQLMEQVMSGNKVRLQAMLDQGTITRDQYEDCLTNMEARVKERLANNTVCSPGQGQQGKRWGKGMATSPGRGQGCGNCPQFSVR